MTPHSPPDLLYHERLKSNPTTALFLALTLAGLLLFLWRLTTARLDWLALVGLGLALLFLFYTLNFRTLDIRLSPTALTLSFGVFRVQVPRARIASAAPDDDIPAIFRYGGAGIHFYLLGRHYRASFNFLDHPRIVLAFQRPFGPFTDLSFSTRHPDQLLYLLQQPPTPAT